MHGFLCPGHVAVVTGSEHFRFLPEEYGLPAVVAGFEPEDILLSVYELLRMLADDRPGLVNEYKRAVSPGGNALARAMLERCFTPARASWRGLGEIEASGLAFGEELSAWDAAKKFDIRPGAAEAPTACRCGEVITGRLAAGGLPAIWEALYAGGSRRALHGVLGGSLRRGVQISGVLRWMI